MTKVPWLEQMRQEESQTHGLYTKAEREEEKAIKLELQLYANLNKCLKTKSKICHQKLLTARKKIIETMKNAGKLRMNAIPRTSQREHPK